MKKDAKTNPEETKESKKRPEGSEQLVEQIHRKRRRSLKFWLIGALVLLIAVGILVGVLVLRHRRNDGARYAALLSERLGASLSDAQSHAEVSLYTTPACGYLTDVGKYNALMESEKRVSVCGIQIPQWAIFCTSDATGRLSTVRYCNYTVLEDSILGQKKSGYILLTDLVKGTSKAEMLNVLGLDPYTITYRTDASAAEYCFRYCYKDGDSKDMLCYQIRVQVQDDQVLAVSDERVNVLTDLLAFEKEVTK